MVLYPDTRYDLILQREKYRERLGTEVPRRRIFRSERMEEARGYAK
jgi:hypothetical protein